MDIEVIRAAERVVAEGDATSGMVRELAIAGGGVWVGVVRAAPHRPSGWHHHGDHDTYFYVVEGTITMEFGPGGSREIHAEPGDFVHVPPHVTHREVNSADSEAVVILMRQGDGPPVVNLDGPV